jgi:hypothetical protein
MPKPVELPDHIQRGFRTRWMESVLGAILVLLLVVAACALGFVLVKYIRSRSAAPSISADATGDPEPTAGDQQPANSTPAVGDSKSANPIPVVGVPKSLPRPAYLAGMWESRLDDGMTSAFIFRTDGSAVIIQAGDPPPPPSFFNWFLVSHKGDEHIIDIGPEFGQIGNARITIRLTSADAFSMLRQMRAGIVQPGGELRYVRIGPPPDKWPPPQPVSSFVGPPAPDRTPVKPSAAPPAP